MALIPDRRFISLKPRVNELKMPSECGIVLNASRRVACRLTSKHFPYGLPIMPSLSLNLSDALSVDTMSRPNVLILIHCDHPLHPSSNNRILNVFRVTRRRLGVGDFSTLILLSGG
jgi:hypothetical protein